jgi:S1-C subfamily serine protease
LLYIDIPIKPLPLGNSLEVRHGDFVTALGYPLGIVREPTIVNGIVSATDLSLETQFGPMHGIVQTTLPLNPGFSGGPILNIDGNVIGVARAIILGAQLMSYATPINFVKPFIKSLTTRNTIEYPSLQITSALYNPLLKETYRQNYPMLFNCASSLDITRITTIIVESYNPTIPTCAAILSVSVGNITIDYPTPGQVVQALYEAYWRDQPLVMTIKTTTGIQTITPKYVLIPVQ